MKTSQEMLHVDILNGLFIDMVSLPGIYLSYYSKRKAGSDAIDQVQ